MKIFATVVAASLLLHAPLCAASGVDDKVLGRKSDKKEAFTPKECLNVVKKVQKSGKYTEEAIVPVCREELPREHCDFFAEALSLASSHSDFKGEAFCLNMDRAQLCSGIMSTLLESNAVSDMAFGECERAKPEQDIAYCRKIQQLLPRAVKDDDLDTMRTCYMMEAYTNQTASQAMETTEASPKMRIITGGSKELESVGKGGGPGHPPKESNVGRPDIVLQPTPLERFGKGKGNVTAPKPKRIITEPVPAGSVPAPAAPAPAAEGPIVALPIPASTAAKTGLLVVAPSRLATAARPAASQPSVVTMAAPTAPVTQTVAQVAVPDHTLPQAPPMQRTAQAGAAASLPTIPAAATPVAMVPSGTPAATATAPATSVQLVVLGTLPAATAQAATPVQVVLASSLPARPASVQVPAVRQATKPVAPQQAPPAVPASQVQRAPTQAAVPQSAPKAVVSAPAIQESQPAAAAYPATAQTATPVQVVLASSLLARPASVQVPAVRQATQPVAPQQAPPAVPASQVQRAPTQAAVPQSAPKAVVSAPAIQSQPAAAAAAVSMKALPALGQPVLASTPAARAAEAPKLAQSSVQPPPAFRPNVTLPATSASRLVPAAAPNTSSSGKGTAVGTTAVTATGGKQKATVRAVSRHPLAGLAQEGMKHKKLGKKDEYGGFLSKFVD